MPTKLDEHKQTPQIIVIIAKQIFLLNHFEIDEIEVFVYEFLANFKNVKRPSGYLATRHATLMTSEAMNMKIYSKEDFYMCI